MTSPRFSGSSLHLPHSNPEPAGRAGQTRPRGSILRRAVGGAAAFAAIACLTLAGCLKHADDVPAQARPAQLPHYNHVVVVIEENHTADSIMSPGSPAPEMRALAAGGASFTQSYAVVHPSQPNYLALFSGSLQGVTDDSLPKGLPFTAPNLGASLLAHGYTFCAYSDSLPSPGFEGEQFTTHPGINEYLRKHCPWVNWQVASPGKNQLPASVNQPFAGHFPTKPDGDFDSLPTVAFVIPDEQHDMHDGSIAASDTWLHENLGAYAEWAKTHNSLLIVTWDEDDAMTPVNRIPTFFYGAHIKPGLYREHITHYSVLRTIEDIFSLPPVGESAEVPPITNVFD